MSLFSAQPERHFCSKSCAPNANNYFINVFVFIKHLPSVNDASAHEKPLIRLIGSGKKIQAQAAQEDQNQ